MPTKKTRRAPVARAAARDPDPIRIVPIAAPRDLTAHTAAVPAAPPPSLTYRGGPLLAAVRVFTIYIGAAWTGHQKKLASELDAFFKFVLGSELIDQLAEYDAPNYKIEHGKFAGSVTLASLAPAPSVTDAWIRKTLNTAIAGGGSVPKPSSNLLYFLYLPPGVTLVQGGGRSCQAFCGYHDHISKKVFYAAMPFPNCNGCLGGLSQLDALTSTSSHELCEAITDPIPGTGWYDDVHGEIGDICAWEDRRIGTHTVQLEWSNTQRRCR